MSHIMRIGAWQIKPEANIAPISELVAAWSKSDGIPGTLVSIVEKYSTFMLPDELVKTYQIPADPSWMQRDYTHCLFVIFADQESRKQYDTHPKHLALSELLIPALVNGMDSILSFDVTLPKFWHKNIISQTNR